MQADPRLAGRPRARRLHCFCLALCAAAGLYGCASPAQPSGPRPSGAAYDPAPPAPPPVPASTAALPSPAEAMLGHAERVRNLQSAELAQEINRLGDPQDSAPRLIQLAIALAATRTPANSVRAQALLQRVLTQADAQAQALHPLARMLQAQYTETRRLEEQVERQNQQVKEAHRRIDQLNDRLEALRAIERSLPRPAAAASAPANNRP